MAAAGGSQADMTKLFNRCVACLKYEMDAKDSQGRPKYTDVCEWLADQLATPEARAQHKASLVALLDQCKDLTAAEVTDSFQDSIPDQTKYIEGGVEHLKKFSLRLWQLGVHELSQPQPSTAA